MITLEASGVLSWSISQLVADVLPFRIVRGSAELIVARNTAGWRITLINNLGVTKECTYSAQWPHGGCTPDQIDPTQRQTVELEWDAQRHGRLHLASELITNTDVAISARGGAGTGADSVVVQVPAGEVRVLSLE